MSKGRWTQSRVIPILLSVTLFVSLALSIPTGLNAKTSRAPWQSWISDVDAGHELTGTIWSKKRGATGLTPEGLANVLSTYDYILIGEIHDNPDHHRLQAWLMRTISSHDRRPVVVMEMIREDQQEALDTFRDDPKKPYADLGPAIGWEKSGWPDWDYYKPIAKAVYDYRLDLFYGNPSRNTIKEIGAKGFDALPATKVRELTLDKALGSELTDGLLKDLEAGHCGMVKGHALRPMAKIQQFRDALMADQLLKTGGVKGGFLIAGNGHIRNDRAVPFYLKRRDPYYRSASVMLIEVRHDAKSPADLIPKDSKGAPVADFVWFTPAKKRDDPCEKLKKHFKQMTKSKPNPGNAPKNN